MSRSDPYDFIFGTWAKTKNQPQCSWWSSFRLGPFGFIFAFCLPFCFVGTCWNTPLVLELVDKTWWKQWLSRHKKEKTMDCDYLITPFCFYKAWNTYLKAGFGYVWIQYLIDFGENKIQGSQACRILLGSMVGIYWIYALFGGHYCLGRKGCSQNKHATNKKKNYGLWLPDYSILLVGCDWERRETKDIPSLEHVWDSIFDRCALRSSWFHKHIGWPWTPSVLFLEHFGCWLGTFLILFLEPLDFIFANPSVGWLVIFMIFSLRNVWGWTPLISFLHFGGQ